MSNNHLSSKTRKLAFVDDGGVLGSLGVDGHGGTEEPCPELGRGWTKCGTKRKKGDRKGNLDYYYCSPGSKKLKSLPEARKFIALLHNLASGNEDKAWKLLNGEKPSSYQIQQVQSLRWDMLENFFGFLHENNMFDLARRCKDQCHQFGLHIEKDHSKHYANIMVYYNNALQLQKSANADIKKTLPYLMTYSGDFSNLNKEEGAQFFNCLKNSTQYQPIPPAGESDETRAKRHAQMELEIKEIKKKNKAKKKKEKRDAMTQEEQDKDLKEKRARIKRARDNMTQEEQHQDLEEGRARKKRARGNMTQEEKEQDLEEGRARKKRARGNRTKEEKEQDLEQAKKRRTAGYAKETQSKEERQAKANKRLNELLDAPISRLVNFPPLRIGLT